MTITGPQCRAARALVEVSRDRLAQLSQIDTATIEQFERKLAKPSNTQIKALIEALEKAGALFIPENGGGAGVRLKFNQSETRRIANLENEGGPTASDDVP